MPLDARTIHGTLTEVVPTDETNFLISSVRHSAAREAREYKGAEGAVNVVREHNPTMEVQVTGIITAISGLADDHPGDAITTLANFGTSVFGFDPADGVMIYRDPSRESSNEDQAEVSFTAAHRPLVA